MVLMKMVSMKMVSMVLSDDNGCDEVHCGVDVEDQGVDDSNDDDTEMVIVMMMMMVSVSR